MDGVSSRWGRIARALSRVVLAVGLLASSVACVRAQDFGNGERRVIVRQGALPFRDSIAAMMARDARHFSLLPGWGWNITRKPIRPRPVPGHKPKPEPIGLSMDWYAPPRFLGEAAPLDKPGIHPAAPQVPGASFAGLSLQDEYNLEHFGVIPPDTMGAIGPNHFVEVVNSGVAIYLRGGTRVSYVTIDSFFTVGSSPINGAFDPRVVYDRRSGRFFACALEFGPWVNPNNTSLGTNKGNIILAVSRNSDPTGTWDKYIIPVGVLNFFTDFDTLGVDDNGVYFAAHLFPVSTGTDSVTIAATPKAPLLAASPSLGTVYAFTGISDMYATPQPAVNLDPAAPTAPAWIVSSSTVNWGDVLYRTITWSGGAPTLSVTTTLSTPGYYTTSNPPALGSSVAIEAGDDRLQNAVIRNGKLWTCRDVAVTSSGGGGTGADRWAVEWFSLALSGSTASVSQNGRIYDPSASPRHYYYGSVAASGQGHAALGFSGSNSAQYVAAYTAGRLNGDPAGTMQSILQLKAGEAPYQILDGSRNRWGDYSFTSLDPNDDMTIWTIQEYAAGPGANTTNNWGTWITRLLAPAPTITSATGSANAGQTGVTLPVTGTGFYDPGSGFAQRLNIQLTGGATNGISNYVVTYNSPTSASVTFDVAANASPGTRDVVLTNPDGQSATYPAGFTVNSGKTPTLLILQSVSAAPGRGIRSWAWMWRSDTWASLSGMPLTFSIDGAQVASGVTASDGGMLFTYTLPQGMAIGAHTMSVAFAGDATFAPSSATAALTVTATGDTTVWVQPAQTAPGQNVLAPAQLTCSSDLQPLSGKTLSLKLDGVTVGSGVTGADGFARILAPISAGIALGAHTTTASFAGDSGFNASTGNGTLNVVGKGSTFLWVGSGAGIQGGGVRVWAWLWRTSDWTSLAGKPIVFSVDGSPVQTVSTSIDGGALLLYTIPSTLSTGTHTLTAAFAGDAAYLGCSASGTLTVTSTVGTDVYVSPRSTGQNQPVLLSARLTSSADLSPLAGRSLSFTIDATPAGSATTGSDGFATLTASTTGLSVGSHTIGASFAGAGPYLAGSGSATLTISSQGDTYLWVSSVSGAANQTVHIWAWLWRTSDWTSLSGKTILFTVNGSMVGSVATNSTGGALLLYTIPSTMAAGDYTVSASFAGDGSYNASNASGTLTVTP